MNINDYLQNLGEQNVQEIKQIQVFQNPVVDEICEKYEQWKKKSRSSLSLGVKRFDSPVAFGTTRLWFG